MPDHLQALCGVLQEIEIGGGKRIIVTMPPRHGKSLTTSELFPAWFLGRNPDKRLILASYAATLSQKFSRSVRNLVSEPRYQAIFPGLILAPDSRSSSVWDVYGKRGGMIAAGVGGGITGHGADLLIVDDPIKDAREADSALVRDRLWDWFTTTAYTRLHPGGSVLVIATRWHEEDLSGRLKAQSGKGGADVWEEIHFPAIDADDNALWSERYPLAELRRIEASVGSRTWEALYQGRPTPPEGGLLKRGWFKIVDASPREGSRVRYWDKAGTEGGGAYTTGILILKAPNGVFYVEDVVRGQWSEFERESMIRQTAELDRMMYGAVDIWIEQEPGSGGLDSARATIRNLAGFYVRADRPSGDKVIRAKPFAAQAEAGNVLLVRGEWNRAYLEELSSFPYGRYKDQVDGSSGALSKLANVSQASMSKAL